jgi:hypothetical protein
MPSAHRVAAMAFLIAGEGCSLLAPSRDELSGGKPTAQDAAADDASGGMTATDGTTYSDTSITDASLSEEGAQSPSDAAEASVTVGKCNLGAVGQWQAVTPPDVSVACPDSGNCANFGVEAFALDPHNAGTIYLGTSAQGIFKSTDCGTTWKQINTGSNNTSVSAGTQNVLEIDPVDPRVMYTKGANQAAFKTSNGGVDWDQMWPPADANLSKVVDYNDVQVIALDPLDHHHILLTFGNACRGQAAKVCFAETSDAGTTWHFVNGKAEWAPGGGGTSLWILDATTRLYSSSPDGFWRSGDAGATWQQLSDASVGEARGRLFRALNGTYYLGARAGIFRSPDGVVWSLTKGTQGVFGGVTSDGTILYASSLAFCSEWAKDLQLYSTSPVSDGKTWDVMPAPGMTQGAVDLHYDLEHRVLYSSNCRQGFWRVVTR